MVHRRRLRLPDDASEEDCAEKERQDQEQEKAEMEEREEEAAAAAKVAWMGTTDGKKTHQLVFAAMPS